MVMPLTKKKMPKGVRTSWQATSFFWLIFGLIGAGVLAAHAQSQNRNGDSGPQFRPPQVPGFEGLQRSYSPAPSPQFFQGTNTPRTPRERTSPRLNQFRKMQQSKLARQQGKSTTRTQRPVSPRKQLHPSGPLSATGLNPTRNVAPDIQLIRKPRNLLPKSHQDSEQTFSGTQELEVHFDADDENLKVRRWVDNTGTFSTSGKLVAVIGSHVRLLKQNGHTTTVPNSRLSKEDLDYIKQQIAAQDPLQPSF